MIKIKPVAGGDAPTVKSIVDQVEALEEEGRGIGADKRDIYARAKKAGYNTKAIRKIIQERRTKRDDSLEADMDTYRHALDLAAEAASNGDMSLRTAARTYGVSKSAVQRRVPRKENPASGTPHDAETGEIGEASQGGADRLATSDCGLTAATAPLGSTEREARPPTPPEGKEQPSQAAPPAMESRSPVIAASAEQPCDTGNAAVVPTREDGRAGERDAGVPPPVSGLRGGPGLAEKGETNAALVGSAVGPTSARAATCAVPLPPAAETEAGDRSGTLSSPAPEQVDRPAATDTRTFDEIAGEVPAFLRAAASRRGGPLQTQK